MIERFCFGCVKATSWAVHSLASQDDVAHWLLRGPRHSRRVTHPKLHPPQSFLSRSHSRGEGEQESIIYVLTTEKNQILPSWGLVYHSHGRGRSLSTGVGAEAICWINTSLFIAPGKKPKKAFSPFYYCIERCGEEAVSSISSWRMPVLFISILAIRAC